MPTSSRARFLRMGVVLPAWLALVALGMAVPLAAQGPPGMVMLSGTVEDLPASPDLTGEWRVAGVAVHVSSDTRIPQRERVTVGVHVKVLGQPRPDGSVTAHLIIVHAEPMPPVKEHFAGVIESLPETSGYLGDWVVSGLVVEVTEDTRIHQEAQPVALGATVVGQGTPRSGGGVVAEHIVVLPSVPAPPPVPVDAVVLVLRLQPTADAPEDAEGVALARWFQLSGGATTEDLKVAVSGLEPETLHDVVIDGFHAGSILTNAHGRGLLYLSTRDIPAAEPLPEELRPVTELGLVQVLDAGGVAVLTGHFDDARRFGRGGGEGVYTATAVLRDALDRPTGLSLAFLREQRQDLHVAVWHLQPLAEYTIAVDGRDLGVVSTDRGGAGRVMYSTEAVGDARPLPEEFMPVSSLLLVEIKDAGGTVVASGSFTSAGQPPAVRTVSRPGLRRH